MVEFDFDAARRWAGFDPQRTLARQGDKALPFVNENLIGGQGVMLDTCVYIDQMQGRSPQILDDLIAPRQVNHSTIAIQELMHTGRRAEPVGCAECRCHYSDWKADQSDATVSDIRTGYNVLGRAALLSGILYRLQGYHKDAKLRALQDCVLCLQAQKLGLVVLTAMSASTMSCSS
jgi:hypothetical protein